MKRFNGFDYVGKFYGNSIAAARKGTKWGYVNRRGKIIIPMIYDWSYAPYDGIGVVGLDGKYAFINEDGKLLTDFVYSDCISNEMGCRAVKRGKKIRLFFHESGFTEELIEKS